MMCGGSNHLLPFVMTREALKAFDAQGRFDEAAENDRLALAKQMVTTSAVLSAGPFQPGLHTAGFSDFLHATIWSILTMEGAEEQFWPLALQLCGALTSASGTVFHGALHGIGHAVMVLAVPTAWREGSGSCLYYRQGVHSVSRAMTRRAVNLVMTAPMRNLTFGTGQGMWMHWTFMGDERSERPPADPRDITSEWMKIPPLPSPHAPRSTPWLSCAYEPLLASACFGWQYQYRWEMAQSASRLRAYEQATVLDTDCFGRPMLHERNRRACVLGSQLMATHGSRMAALALCTSLETDAKYAAVAAADRQLRRLACIYGQATHYGAYELVNQEVAASNGDALPTQVPYCSLINATVGGLDALPLCEYGYFGATYTRQRLPDGTMRTVSEELERQRSDIMDI